MLTKSITIQVDADAAQAFIAAPADERAKIQRLLNLRLRELTTSPRKPLKQVMDEISAKAQARGLTPEILESILQDE